MTLGAGDSVGFAYGAIRINTRSLVDAREVVVREAQLMGRALTNAGTAGAQAATGLGGAWQRASAQMNAAFNGLSSVLSVVSLGGIKAANSVKSIDASFRLLAGSEQAAARYLADIQDLADKTNQPFLQLKESAITFLPAVKASNVELSKTVSIAQRLLLKDPTARAKDAAIAINEFLSGEYVSLARRFEINRDVVQGILDASGGDAQQALEGLEAYLDTLGLTEEAVTSMGRSGVNAFAILRDEALQTSAMAFEPIATAINKIAAAFADVLRQARSVNPELLKIVGTMGALVGLSKLPQVASILPGVSQVPGAGKIAKAGVGAAALYGGVQLGAGAVRLGAGAGIGELEQYKGESQSGVLSAIETIAKQAVVLVVNAFGQAAVKVREGGFVVGNALGVTAAAAQLGAAKLGNAFASVVDVLADAAASIAEFIGKFLLSIDEIDLGTIDAGILGERDLGSINLGTGGAGEALLGFADSLDTVENGLRTSDATMQGFWDTLARGIGLTDEQQADLEATSRGIDDMVLGMADMFGLIEKATPIMDVVGQAAGSMLGGLQRAISIARAEYDEKNPQLIISDEMVDAYQQYQDDLKRIQVEAQEARVQEIMQYNDRRAEIQQEYQRRVVEIQEDEAIRYARALDNARRRAADITNNLAETLAEEEAESREKIADMTTDYHRDSEKRAEAHMRKLNDIREGGRRAMEEAAMKLDAVALWRAQRNTEGKLETEQDAYAREEQERADRFHRMLEQEVESQEERTQAAREAAQERLNDLWANFNRQEQLRREDFDRQLSRMRDNHQRQLADLDAQHRHRLNVITAQAAQESNALRQTFLSTFNQLARDAGNHQSTLININRGGQAVMAQDVRNWWASMQAAVRQTSGRSGGSTSRTRDSGGLVPESGLYRLKAGEYVLRDDVTRAVARMQGGTISQPRLMSALAGSGARAGATVNVGDVVVQGGGDAYEAAKRAADMVFEQVIGALQST